MRKYFVSTICLLLFLMSCLTLHAASPRVVRVGAFNYYPGIFKDTDGAVKGFYVDALADIAQKENIRFEYLYGSWSEGLERIKTGEVDLLTSVAFTPERAEFLDYAKTPLLTVWGELYVPLSSDIDGILAVKGKKIAVMKNDFNARHFIELVKKFNLNCEFIEMPGFEEVFKAVAAKQVDAGVVNNTFGAARQKEFALRSTGVVFNPFDIFFAVAKGKNSDLLQMLDNYLHNWKHQKDSPYKKARQKWSHGSKDTIEVIPKWLITSVGVLTILALCAFVFIVVLKKQVLSKTRSVIEASKRYQAVSERQSAILAAVPDIIMEVDSNKVYTWANSAGLEFFGDDVVGREASFYFAGEQDTYEVVQPLFDESEDVVYVESLQRRKDGEVRLLAWWCKVLRDEQGNQAGGLSSARDISENKRIETALRTNENRQAKMIKNIGDVIVIIDRNGINRYKSPNVEKWFGWKPEELVGFSAWDKLHPDDRAVVQEFVGTLIRKPGTSRTTECRYRCKNGNYKWIEITLINLLDDPDILGILGDYHDITERKQIEEVQSYLLQMSAGNPVEDFFETLARYLAKTLNMDYVCIDTLHGDGLTASTLAIYHDGKFEVNVEYALKDTPCGDVVGKEVCVFPRKVCSLFPHDPALQELQAESYLGTTLWSFDLKPIGLIAVIGRKELLDSHFAESMMKLVSVRAAGELERRQSHAEKHLLEQQFQQTQKLESLGVLAGGIAHDFNNILAIIIGYCGLTKMNYESAEKNISEIEKASERAAALCRQMLAYAGKATLTESQVNTSMLVDEMVSMLKTTSQKNVVIKPELGTDIPMIKGDASQLRQVVMNLVINAAEAIGDAEGEIEVRQQKAEIKAEQPEKDHLGVVIPAGSYICIEVSDNGCGMDDDTRRKIFEPFYTTKFTGRGLGMSAVLGIIKAHNGALQLESRLGQGTTFKVYLPVQPGKSEADEAHQKAVSPAWQGSGTILLAEDEVQVRSIATILLKEIGFNVLEAANGKEALELYQQNAADITLVITDMGMPVMNGYELFYRLKQLDPKLPIIISSGFGEGDIGSKIPRDDIAGLINKPYRFDQLRDVVRGVVE